MKTNLTNEATKDQTIAAGLDIMSRATPAQQANHQKVIDWVKTLKNVPSTTNAATTYKECCREWHAVHVLGKPLGTGAYNLETLSAGGDFHFQPYPFVA